MSETGCRSANGDDPEDQENQRRTPYDNPRAYGRAVDGSEATADGQRRYGDGSGHHRNAPVMLPGVCDDFHCFLSR